jgi:5-methyltetrahydropteroyltriglutamate--homocysteine methyltransferase
MMQLPARYDHVGSFLRPQYLLEARAQKARARSRPRSCAPWKTRPSPRS